MPTLSRKHYRELASYLNAAFKEADESERIGFRRALTAILAGLQGTSPRFNATTFASAVINGEPTGNGEVETRRATPEELAKLAAQ